MNNPQPATGISPDPKRLLPPIACGASMGGFFMAAAGALIAILSRDLGVQPQDLAGIGSAFGVAMIVTGLVAPWGLRFGGVWFLRIAPLLAASGAALLAWAPNIPVILIGSMVAALAGGMMSATAAATFRGVEGVKYLSVSTGVASTVSVTSTLLFGLVEQLAPGHGRLAVWFVMLAVIPTLLLAWRAPTVPFMVFMRGHPKSSASPNNAGSAADVDSIQNSVAPHETETPSETKAEPAAKPDLTSAAAATAPSSPAVSADSKSESAPGNASPTSASGKPTRRVSPLIFFSQILRLILQSGVEFGLYAWAVTRFEQLGVSLAAASGLATGFAVGMAAGRLGGARFTRIRAAWWVFVALGASGTALAAYVPNVWVAMVGFFIAGLGGSCLYPISASDFTGMPGIRPQRAVAIIAVLAGSGALGTPILLGILLGTMGLQVSFAVLLGFYALLAILPRPPRV